MNDQIQISQTIQQVAEPNVLTPEVQQNVELPKHPRRSVTVWVYSLKQLKTLKRFGFIQYVSKRMKYVVIYMDDDQVEEAEIKLNKLHFVRSVERSYRPDVEMNFAEKIGTQAAYGTPDEEEGFDVAEVSTTIKLADNL